MWVIDTGLPGPTTLYFDRMQIQQDLDLVQISLGNSTAGPIFAVVSSDGDPIPPVYALKIEFSFSDFDPRIRFYGLVRGHGDDSVLWN